MTLSVTWLPITPDQLTLSPGLVSGCRPTEGRLSLPHSLPPEPCGTSAPYNLSPPSEASMAVNPVMPSSSLFPLKYLPDAQSSRIGLGGKLVQITSTERIELVG